MASQMYQYGQQSYYGQPPQRHHEHPPPAPYATPAPYDPHYYPPPSSAYHPPPVGALKDPNDPKAQAWADYYAKGGTDPTGFLFFVGGRPPQPHFNSVYPQASPYGQPPPHHAQTLPPQHHYAAPQPQPTPHPHSLPPASPYPYQHHQQPPPPQPPQQYHPTPSPQPLPPAPVHSYLAYQDSAFSSVRGRTSTQPPNSHYPTSSFPPAAPHPQPAAAYGRPRSQSQSPNPPHHAGLPSSSFVPPSSSFPSSFSAESQLNISPAATPPNLSPSPSFRLRPLPVGGLPRSTTTSSVMSTDSMASAASIGSANGRPLPQRPPTSGAGPMNPTPTAAHSAFASHKHTPSLPSPTRIPKSSFLDSDTSVPSLHKVTSAADAFAAVSRHSVISAATPAPSKRPLPMPGRASTLPTPPGPAPSAVKPTNSSMTTNAPVPLQQPLSPAVEEETLPEVVGDQDFREGRVDDTNNRSPSPPLLSPTPMSPVEERHLEVTPPDQATPVEAPPSPVITSGSIAAVTSSASPLRSLPGQAGSTNPRPKPPAKGGGHRRVAQDIGGTDEVVLDKTGNIVDVDEEADGEEKEEEVIQREEVKAKEEPQVEIPDPEPTPEPASEPLVESPAESESIGVSQEQPTSGGRGSRPLPSPTGVVPGMAKPPMIPPSAFASRLAASSRPVNGSSPVDTSAHPLLNDGATGSGPARPHTVAPSSSVTRPTVPARSPSAFSPFKGSSMPTSSFARSVPAPAQGSTSPSPPISSSPPITSQAEVSSSQPSRSLPQPPPAAPAPTAGRVLTPLESLAARNAKAQASRAASAATRAAAAMGQRSPTVPPISSSPSVPSSLGRTSVQPLKSPQPSTPVQSHPQTTTPAPTPVQPGAPARGTPLPRAPVQSRATPAPTPAPQARPQPPAAPQSMALRLAQMELQEEAEAAKRPPQPPSQPQNRALPSTSAYGSGSARGKKDGFINLDDRPPESLRRSPSPSASHSNSRPLAHSPSPSVPVINFPGAEEDESDVEGPSIVVSAPSVTVSSAPSIKVDSSDSDQFGAGYGSARGHSRNQSHPLPNSGASSMGSRSSTMNGSTPSPYGSSRANGYTPSPASSRPLPPINPGSAMGRRAGGLRCNGCDGLIAGRIVSAMGKRWHPNCFKCDHCGELLEHVSSYEHEGKPYCHLDYHELFAPRCYHCKTSIADERFITVTDDGLSGGSTRYYHELHFFCAECGDPFLHPSASSAAPKGQKPSLHEDGTHDVGFTVYNGHPYCEACHVRLRMPRCAGCKGSIRDEVVEALGKKWHFECFVCDTCKTPFEDPSFFQRGDKAFCDDCYTILIKSEM